MLKRIALLPALFALCLFAHDARADTVVLTSGTVTTLAGVGSVQLAGPGFSLNYLGEIPLGSPSTIGLNSVTQSFGFPFVTYNGVTATIFSGSLTFNDSLLTGNVTAYATMDDLFFRVNPLFMVDFSGPGFITVSNVGGFTQRQFTVATPEPVTLLLFGTGLAGAAATRLRRRRRGDQTP
jgi:hypothetical protein